MNEEDFDCYGICEGCERMGCLNKYNACEGCHAVDVRELNSYDKQLNEGHK